MSDKTEIRAKLVLDVCFTVDTEDKEEAKTQAEQLVVNTTDVTGFAGAEDDMAAIELEIPNLGSNRLEIDDWELIVEQVNGVPVADEED
jgi:hypothetical protein